MTRFLSLLLLFLACLIGQAAQATNTQQMPSTQQEDSLSMFDGEFYNPELGLRMHLDLSAETIEVPNMEFLGPMHGYMSGGIYGVWMLVKHEWKKDKVWLRFSNDIGADSQTIELSRLSDGKYQYRALGENLVRKVVGRKLVRIPDTMIMIKVDKK